MLNNTNLLDEKQTQVFNNVLELLTGLAFADAEMILFELLNKIKVTSVVTA